MNNLMKSVFLPRKNVKLNHIESYNPRERYQANIVLFQNVYEIDLKISLQ